MTSAVAEKPAAATTTPAAEQGDLNLTLDTEATEAKAALAPAAGEVKTEIKAEPKPAEKPEAAKPAAADAPYTAPTLTAPDGSLLDKSDIERITKEAADKKLTQEQANELLARENEAAKRFKERSDAQWKAEQDRWVKESTEDREIGGANLNETRTLAQSVLKRFDTKGSVSKFLEETGLGNNREVLSLLRNVGLAMKPDTIHGKGGAPIAPPKSTAEVLFGRVGEAT